MISKSAHQAVRACLVLRDLPKGEHAGAQEIAAKVGARPSYLAKVLQALSRRGVLDSRKGKGGGFRLGSPPQKITFAHILESVEGFPGPSECLFRKRFCPGGSFCRVQCRWRPVRKAYDRFLSKTTLADVPALPLSGNKGRAARGKGFKPQKGAGRHQDDGHSV